MARGGLARRPLGGGERPGGARIEAATIVEGRRATVIGIVRRPYPGASDRRWSVVPRGPDDVVIGDAASGGGAGGADGSSSAAAAGAARPDAAIGCDRRPGRRPRRPRRPRRARSFGSAASSTELAPDGFLLDDGTAIGRIVLTGEAAEYLPLIEPGDALNATGRVEAGRDAFRVVVDEAAGLVRVGDPTAARPSSAARARIGAGRTAPRRAPPRLAGGLFGGVEPGAAGMAGVVLLSGLSLAITGLRRRRARRLLAARVAARLARVAEAPPG